MTPQAGQTPAADVESAKSDAADRRLRRKGQATSGPSERRPSTRDDGSRQGKSHTGSQTTGHAGAEYEVPNANQSTEELYASLNDRLDEVAKAEGDLAGNRWVAVAEVLHSIYIREKVAETDQRKMAKNIEEMFERHGLVKENLLRLNLLVRCSDTRLANKREKEGLRNGITLSGVDGEDHTFLLDNEAGIAALRTLGRSMTSVYQDFTAHINAVAGPRNQRAKAVRTLEEVADAPETIKHRVQNEDGTYESKSFAENKDASMRLVVGLCKLWGPKLTQEEREGFMDRIEAALTAAPAFVPQASKQQQAKQAKAS